MNDRPLVSMDARSSSWEEPPWPSAFELARLLPRSSWTLVGGLMVKLHAELAELPAPLTTVDVDSALHLETQAITFAGAAAALHGAGYVLDKSTKHAYRFDRVGLSQQSRRRVRALVKVLSEQAAPWANHDAVVQALARESLAELAGLLRV